MDHEIESPLILDRPLVVIDLETTGTDLQIDRIVEIGLVRIGITGRRSEYHAFVNPGIPIPMESTAVHHIDDARVAKEPLFADIAPDVLDFLEGADLGGFNHIRFDLPMLQKELSEARYRWDYSKQRVVDVQTIFHRMEPRDLGAAFRFYTGANLIGAHGALADARATFEVLLAQLQRYPELPRDLPALAARFAPLEDRYPDSSRRFIWRHGEPCFNFGDRRGTPLRVIAIEDPEYLDWILQRDFPPDVKELARDALKGIVPRRDPATGEVRPQHFDRPGKKGASAAKSDAPGDVVRNEADKATKSVSRNSLAAALPEGMAAALASAVSESPADTAAAEIDRGRLELDGPESIYARAIRIHAERVGKIEVRTRMRLDSPEGLSLAYTPGVAGPCEAIARDPARAWDLTWKGRAVAVVSDGSAVLGLGDIGPLAALPVMEGKAALFKEFGGLDAVPIVVDQRDPDQFVAFVRALAPGFGGINLEDISAPRCFEIEERLQDLGIPVLHDDQHGTAIVLLAAIRNASRALGRSLDQLAVVVSGAGAAGRAIVQLLSTAGRDGTPIVRKIRLVDSRGIVAPGRGGQDRYKEELAQLTNPKGEQGSLEDALFGADVFVGVSRANLLGPESVRAMAKRPILFAMANPIPEIDPAVALQAGAAIVGTGRSDYPNQVNNVLAFPGLFRGALAARAPRFTREMKLAAVEALVQLVPNPRPERILPEAFSPLVAPAVAAAVERAAIEGLEARNR